MKCNTAQLFVLSSHYLIVDIHEKLQDVRMWTSIAFSCILERQTM